MFIFANLNQIVIKIHSVLQCEIKRNLQSLQKISWKQRFIWFDEKTIRGEYFSKLFHTAVQSLNAVSWQIFRENTF